MPDIDIFNFFRYIVFVVVTIYATVVTVTSLWSWYVWLMTEDRYIAVLRRYVIVHGLRLRFRTFWGDVIICILLCYVCWLLFKAHTILLDIVHKLA